MAKNGPTIEEVVNGFSTAEAALKELIDRANSLGSAGKKLDVARGSVDLAKQDLVRAREAVEGGADGLAALAREMRELVGEVGRATAALHELEPVAMMTAIEQAEAAVHQIASDLRKAIEKSDSTAEERSVAAAELAETNTREVRTAIASLAEVRGTLGSMTTLISAESSQLKGQVRDVASDVDKLREQIGLIAEFQQETAGRQRILLILLALSLMIAVVSVVLQLLV